MILRITWALFRLTTVPFHHFLILCFNPLAPVPAVTGHDKPWHFIHFWRHHFWPKLASPILNFCRRKRSYKWYPDQSDQPNCTRDMHKNAQNIKWKTQSKISCHYTWLLHGKNCPSPWCFLRSFLTASKPSRSSITAEKKNEKEKKESWKKLKNWKEHVQAKCCKMQR